MGKGRNRRKAKKPRQNKLFAGANKEEKLKLVHWNINGILRDSKLEHLVEILNEENIGLCFLNETLLVHGTNDDLSSLDSFIVYSKERPFGSKMGGGLMTIINPSINHSRWEPGLVMHPYLDAERSWLLVHEGGRNVAVCSIYCAAEVHGSSYDSWNFDLYAMVSAEMGTIRNEGYECLIIGDFNGHIGCDAQGIPGNNPDINHNGALVRDFIHYTGLNLVNSDQARCSGVFTRATLNSISCLDLVLEDNKVGELVEELFIDENNEVLGGSDHSALFVTLKNNITQLPQDEPEEARVPNPTKKNANKYAERLDSLLKEQDWTIMDINAQCEFFISSVKSAAMHLAESRPQFKYKKRSSGHVVRRLRARYLALMSSVRKLSKDLIKVGLDPKTILRTKIEEATKAKLRYREIVQEKKERKMMKIRFSANVNPKQFWKLVRRAERKVSSLSSIRDEHGNLITNRSLVERIVLEQLALIFSGKRSPIFQNRGDQIVQESVIKDSSNWKGWIIPESDPSEHEADVCAPVTSNMVQKLINGLKTERAPGIDGVSCQMLVYAGQEALDLLTCMYNNMLRLGTVPEMLSIGRMTLIDKKLPSQVVTGKRPLTVSSVVLNLFTKIIHERMDRICEEEGYYGPIQFGFRSGRSTTDCVFILLAAIRKAKKRNHVISLAFCDIAKAYDSVNRELLYTKLDAVGFGGRVKSIIQAMYYNDSVQVRIGSGLSSPLWFTRGVKQGCVLSPLLFALYLSGLGKVLHAMKEGINFEGVIISALMFADDLVLISRTRIRGMNRLLRAVHKFCQDMHMKLSVDKTVMLSTGTGNTSWKISDSEPILESALVAKYLGVEVGVKGRNLVKAREAKMIQTARAYAHTIMGCTRVGLDRSLTASTLWESCAIPAILYATEAMVITKATISELDKIQGAVARFVLQLPSSASKVSAYLDAGMKPFGLRLKARQLLFLHAATRPRKDKLVRMVVESILADGSDPWTAQVQEGINSFFSANRRIIKEAIKQYQVNTVRSLKGGFSSLAWMSEPVRWFTLQPHVNDSQESRTINRFRAADVGLGNRRPNSWGFQYTNCPLCEEDGNVFVLNELHVILCCPSVGFERWTRDIDKYIGECNVRGLYSPGEIMKDFLGGDGANNVTMMGRAKDLKCLLDAWLCLVAPT